MAIKDTDKKYRCFFCGEKFDTALEADKCVLTHKLVYVPTTVEELNKLIGYFYEKSNPPMKLILRMKEIIKREIIKGQTK